MSFFTTTGGGGGGKTKSSSEGWGMGFLLVFFPPEEDQQPPSTAIHNNTNNKKRINTTSTLFSPSPSPSPSSSSSSSSSDSFKTINTLLRRSSSSTHILNRAQSTISICAFFLFLTLLLFTLSTFEPTSTPTRTTTTTSTRFSSRRHLSSSSSSKPPFFKPREYSHSSNSIIRFLLNSETQIPPKSQSYALQGMGTLFRRGTRAMNDLIVAHVTESTSPPELRLFLRLLHRSGLTSRSDLVFIFPPSTTPNSSIFHSVIHEENGSISKLIHQYYHNKRNITGGKPPPASFDVAQFIKTGKREKESGEPIWGRKIRSNSSEGEEEGEEEEKLSQGSVVGFDANELDPENSLSGFLDHVPMNLRRWACYPMLLGRVRRNFKHIMLVNAKEMLVVGDPIGPVRNKAPESVRLSTTVAETSRHGKKNSIAKSQLQKPADPAILVGGARGIRRISNSMLTEIVRVAMQHSKKKNSMAESALLNQLVGNGFLVKNINLLSSPESIPAVVDLSIHHTVARRGNSNLDVTLSILKHICSLELYSSFYSDC